MKFLWTKYYWCEVDNSVETTVLRVLQADFMTLLLLLSCYAVSNSATSWTIAHQAPLSFIISWICSDSRALSWWCYLAISSSATLFSLLPSIFPSIPGSFPMRWLVTSGGQSIRASSSATVSLSNAYSVLISYGSTSLILLLSKGLSRVFSSTTIWKHQFFGIQPSSWSNSHILIWLLEKP